MKRRRPPPRRADTADTTDPDDPALVAIATKIVGRSTVGRRWYFHNGVCVAFFRAPESTASEVTP